MQRFKITVNPMALSNAKVQVRSYEPHRGTHRTMRQSKTNASRNTMDVDHSLQHLLEFQHMAAEPHLLN